MRLKVKKALTVCNYECRLLIDKARKDVRWNIRLSKDWLWRGKIDAYISDSSYTGRGSLFSHPKAQTSEGRY